MKARIISAALLLFGAVAIAGGVVDQPLMQAARVDLQTAKRELQLATPDKGGHRVNAIALVNSAIGEVNAGSPSQSRQRFDRRQSVCRRP